MKAIILNSGVGSRLGVYTKDRTKCMTEIMENMTIIQYQFEQLKEAGIKEVIITTGYMREVLEKYVETIAKDFVITFVDNPYYSSTNYIKSLDLIDDLMEEDVILLHGDLVFESLVLKKVLESEASCMVIDKTLELPEKDFKAKICGSKIQSIGIHYFGDDCIAAQPMYKLLKDDWKIWKKSIREFCIDGNDKVYAEEAFNKISNQIKLIGQNINGLLCSEIDNEEDLLRIKKVFGGN